MAKKKAPASRRPATKATTRTAAAPAARPTAQAARAARPTPQAARARGERPRPKDSKTRILPAQGKTQTTAADIPGTSEHARRMMRESAAHNRDNRRAAHAGARGIRVRAIRDGYYGHSRRREGDVFTIRSEKELGRWMEPIDARARESITTPNEVIRKKHDETLALKYGGRVSGAGNSPDDPAADVDEDEQLEDEAGEAEFDDDDPLGSDN